MSVVIPLMTTYVINQEDVQITPLIVTSYGVGNDSFGCRRVLTFNYCYSVGKIVNFSSQTTKSGVQSAMRKIFA